jgi:hypothetical protein
MPGTSGRGSAQDDFSALRHEIGAPVNDGTHLLAQVDDLVLWLHI